MTDVLRWFFAHWEASSLPWRLDDVRRGPEGLLDRLTGLGWIAETQPGTTTSCRSCGSEHDELVESIAGPRGVRHFLMCPTVGRVRVEADDLRRWSAAGEAVARAVAVALQAQGNIVQHVPGRFWGLGRAKLNRTFTPAYLVVGLTRGDAAALRETVRLRSSGGIVFVAAESAPVGEAWLPLVEHLHATADGWSLGFEPPPATFALVPETRSWEEATCFVEDFALTWTTPAGSRCLGFVEAGFENRRDGGKPDRSWQLLALLARSGGVLSGGDEAGWKSETLRQGMSQLRTALKRLAGRTDDPFHPTRRGGAYRARFMLKAAGSAVLVLPADTTWDDLEFRERDQDTLEVRYSVDVHTTAFGTDRREAAVATGERNVSVRFAALGWDAELLESFRLLLRGGNVRDAGGRLAAALRDWTGLSDDPFDGSRSRFGRSSFHSTARHQR